ncbi:MAG: DUF721 domain-containing protein [Bacteroidetes bacterium]|nr:DUF721 domain-containing protein [Bacteroidota bacterium]
MSTNEQNIKEAVNEFLKSTRLGKKLSEQKIISGWEKIMGKMIAKHTKEVSIINKKLFLSLDSAPLKQELFYARSKIIGMLNEEAGEEIIQEIIFR